MNRCGNIDQYNHVTNGVLPDYMNDEEKKIIAAKNITSTRPFALKFFDQWPQAFTAMAPFIKVLLHDTHMQMRRIAYDQLSHVCMKYI